uniref:NADH-ubiquinone oxidoreductase chain 2 n=1 Tax=Parasagitta elegans TaxID=1562708 RepID=A0A141CL63_9BILA|nr:NADH dehydrogenase subunit 2 [Parasagitta elegans]
MYMGVMLGTLVVLSSATWPVAWIGLELNLLAFIAVSMFAFKAKKSAMTYFVCQGSGSLLVIIGGMLTNMCSVGYLFVVAGLVFKMGLLPLHFWVPVVVVVLCRFNLFMLLSWQKVAPLFLLLTVGFGTQQLVAVNAVGGAIMMWGCTTIPLLLIFSGMVQMGWILVTSGAFSVYYVMIYFVVLSAVIYYSTEGSTLLGWALLNAGGLPPFSGFIIKLKAVMSIKTPLVLLLIFSSGMALCSYVRLIVTMRTVGCSMPCFLLFSCGIGLV